MQIIQIHCAGRTNSEIINLLMVVKFPVYHVVKTFKELGTSEDCPRSGKSCTAQLKLSGKGKEEFEEICKTND